MLKLQDLLDQNPWWSENRRIPEESGWPHRDVFDELRTTLAREFVQILLGMRRVGKSTLMRQVVAKLLADGTPPRDICYFSFDRYAVEKTPDALRTLIDLYCNDVLGTRPAQLQRRVYLLVDEIQYVPYWKDLIKRYADQSKRLKFVLSGSQSARLKGASKESLAGRIIEHDIPPLSLVEHAVIRGGTAVERGPTFREALNGAVTVVDILAHVQAHRAGYLADVPAYLCWGQFPQIAAETEAHLARTYVEESVFGKVVEIDLPQLYGIENTEAFKVMARHLVANSGSPFELRAIASDIGISRLTAESYLTYLRAGYVVDVLYRYTRSAIKAGRTLKKGYALSPNFVAAMHRLQPEEYATRPELFGKVVETFVWQRLSQEYPELFFWRKGTKEIDFLLSGVGDRPIPVEAKFSNRVRNEELTGLIGFCHEKKLTDAFVLTRDLVEARTIAGVRIHLLPFYLL